MPWRKAEKRGIGCAWPSDVVNVRPYGIYLGAGFVKTNGLAAARTVNIFSDEENGLMALQFPLDGSGEFIMTPSTKIRHSAAFLVGCCAEVRRMRASHGPHRVRKEASGYFVIDTNAREGIEKG